jgi:hypothetical protein
MKSSVLKLLNVAVFEVDLMGLEGLEPPTVTL